MNVALDGTVTIGDHAKFIETWNRIGIDTVLNNENITWRDKSFTDVTPHEIQDTTTAHGKVTIRVCGTLNNTEKLFFSSFGEER